MTVENTYSRQAAGNERDKAAIVGSAKAGIRRHEEQAVEQTGLPTDAQAIMEDELTSAGGAE